MFILLCFITQPKELNKIWLLIDINNYNYLGKRIIITMEVTYVYKRS